MLVVLVIKLNVSCLNEFKSYLIQFLPHFCLWFAASYGDIPCEQLNKTASKVIIPIMIDIVFSNLKTLISSCLTFKCIKILFNVMDKMNLCPKYGTHNI